MKTDSLDCFFSSSADWAINNLSLKVDRAVDNLSLKADLAFNNLALKAASADDLIAKRRFKINFHELTFNFSKARKNLQTKFSIP